MSKHTILFVAANPFGTTELVLGREAHAIQDELERSGQRDRFEFVTRWAVQPLDLIRELRKLKPTVVHFSGLGRAGRQPGPGPQRNIAVGLGSDDDTGNTVRHSGLFFQGPDGRPQLVTAAALRETFGAAGTSVKLVVLNACYSDIHAEALLVHVDCVVGMHGSLQDDAARTFAIGFYGGLGERQSVAAAYLQGRAAISLDGPSGSETPQLRVRDGVDANQVVLAEIKEVDRKKPIPAFPDAEVEQLSKRLEDARARRDKLRGAGIASDEVDREIIELRRQLREGGRLRAGDALGDGRYLLVKIVGRGGFAVVWEAYDCTAQQRVAIKVLHANLAGDAQCRERFFRGAQAMKRLTHPAVTRVLEPKGEDGNFYYFVMEFISGGNLREAVLERRVNNEDTLPLILRIGEALALAHARGMIHRDIKPANILLDDAGDTKLTDFDLVSAYDTTGGTRSGALGTVVYAAPECLDKPQKATTRADVYGLGMTAIFCLSGQDLSMDTFRNPEETISKLDCSSRVQDVLRRAVAWKPEKRFADAAAMMIELRNASNPVEQAVEFMDVASEVPHDDHPRRTAAAGRGDPLMIPGELLDDRFEIDRSIGSGGMATVFRARDPISGGVVAIKVLSDKRSHLAGRFAREIKVLAELSHPGIVRYISHGVTSTGELFLVMEWVDGEVLKSRLERGPLTPSEAVTFTTRVAEALSAAHAHGIVHRDLKPSNLIFPDGRIDQVKILDFGLAQRGGRSLLTQSGAIIGTPGYMAPEQARASGQIDARADVFALGCVLFQCLTGVPPFDGDTTAAILAKILFEAAPRVSELWPDVPERLDALVAQMLSKDPALRPSDGANLAAALAALGPLTLTAPVASRERTTSSRAATGGERRLLTVVMLGPSAQDDALLEKPLRRAVEPYGGRFEQLADGSAVVMLDPDHQVATDHAARAARCALAMCAIATDRPLAIAMGRTESGSRLPQDDVIDRASRLLTHMTPWPGELPPIALDEVSAGLLDARFDVIEHDSQLRLRGERAVMQGTRTLLGRPTSCVGRDWELGALAGILDDCIEEPAAQVAVMTAAAGMGKSRLGAEFVSRVRERRPELAIWVGRGDSLRAGSTLDLLAQALRGSLGIREGEPLSDRRDKLQRRIAGCVPPADRDRVTAFLGELVGTPMPDDNAAAGVASAALQAARLDAMLMSELMRKAWLDFLHAETAAHPVLLVLDDLHWGDFGTVRFIDAALRDLSKQPWMVLALARPEVYDLFPRLWAERQNVQELRLQELGRRAGERLIRQVLGDAVGSDTVERLIKQADGNAFYLEELIRAVAEGKDQALPETVLAMVETRLARLPFEARQVLRAASVFGEVCWERGVATLLGDAMSAAALGEWLAMLIEQEVLVMRPDSRFPGERELAFRHALLREGAYAMLTADDARLAHRLAGEWLESHGDAEPMVLAGHAQRGGDLPRAARFYLRAAEQAVHVLDNEGAIARATLGLDCDPPPELRFALLGIRCNASHRMQRHALADAEELARSAPPGSVPWAQGMTSYQMATMMTGRDDELQASLRLLAEVTPAPGAEGWVSLVFLAGVFLLDLLGRVAQATALEERYLALVNLRGDEVPLVRFWWNLSVGLRASHAHDDPWTALVHSDAIELISDLIGGDVMHLDLQLLRGINLWYLGAHARAVELLESIPAADTTLGETSSFRRIHLAWLYADRSALDQARAAAVAVLEFCREHRDHLGGARARWALAEVLRRSGDLEGAERELETVRAMAMPLDQPGVLASLAVLRLTQGRPADALAAAEDAMARCAAMGGGCGLFRSAAVRLVHAEALHATGAQDAARRAIAEARTRLLTIAGKIADPSYRTSFLEHVPENARTLTLARAWLDDTAPRAGIDFTAERARHARFVGRAALLAQLDQLLIGEPADCWVVVTGGPGMGKSALLAQWLARREAAGEAVPHHFIRRGEYDWDDPEKLVGSLVAQIVARFPDQPEPEADARMHPAARLQSTLQRVSQRELVPRGERLVVLIDGLDEYDPPGDARAGAPGRDPLAEFLPHTIPRGVSLLCASRPRHPYVDVLVARGALQIDLDDAALADDNAATVRAFWEQAAPELGLGAPFIAEAVDRAAGNPQHAEMLRKRLAGLSPDQRRVEDIPRGLAALLARAWERIATDAAVVDGLGVLCAAREPLTLDELAMVAGWSGATSRHAFVRGARELLIESERADHAAQYRLHHDSIRAEVGRAIGDAVLRGHHRALAQQLATWPASTGTAARRYALHHALVHRVEAGEWAEAWRLAADMTFLEAKCREVGVQNAEADVARTAARCRASSDETHGKRLADLARALVRESHWLQAAPETTGALIWNRLRRSGWSASDLDVQLRVPDGREFLRVRSAAIRENPALVRDLAGHTNAVIACAVTPDGRHVVSASDDGTLRVWELASGRQVATLHGHTRAVWACAVTPDGRHVVSASDDETLMVWELASGRPVATLQGHIHAVWACAVTPDGRHVVSASEDKTLKVWELASGRAVATLQGHTHDVTACAVTPDGRHVVSASYDKTLKVWELASGRAVATLEGHTHDVTACAMTPDGRHVISASEDKTLKVWELASGCSVATLQGHTHWVMACAVTPDGRHVVSASCDQTLKIWELATFACCLTHRGDAAYLAIAVTATAIVAGDCAGTVWFLDLPPSLMSPSGSAPQPSGRRPRSRRPRRSRRS